MIQALKQYVYALQLSVPRRWSVGSGLRDDYPAFNGHLMVKTNSLIDKTTISNGFLWIFFLGRNTRLLLELWEESRNKIGRRTQMRKEISSMDSEELISQSHVSFCRLTQALTRYRRKTKPGRGAYGPDSNTYTPTLNLTLNYGSARALNLSFLPPSTASALCLHSSRSSRSSCFSLPRLPMLRRRQLFLCQTHCQR